MTRRHSSFLVRCWDLGGDGERIEIEHIQSGTKVLVRSVGAAIEWICMHGDAGPRLDRESEEESRGEGGN